MKVTVIGIEVSEGTSKKGEPYAIGTLHTMTELAPAFGGKDNVNKGFSGDRYRADVVLLRKLQSMPFPFVAELTTKPVIRFGKREDEVVDVVPAQVERKAA